MRANDNQIGFMLFGFCEHFIINRTHSDRCGNFGFIGQREGSNKLLHTFFTIGLLFFVK